MAFPTLEMSDKVGSNSTFCTDNPGGLPDCWLDAAMVSMADLYNDFLRARVVTDDGGVYKARVGVILTLKGEKRTYWVNYLDAVTNKVLPGMNSDGSGAWWPAAIESAVQMWGNDHNNTEIFQKGGYPADAIEFLTGVSSSSWFPQDDQEWWEHMQLGSKIPVLLGTRGDTDEKKTQRLISWHIYTVLNAEIINGVKWVTLRNPWHDTQRHRLDDIMGDIKHISHYTDINAKPTNDPLPQPATSQSASATSASADTLSGK